jgi:hypothetical protein
MGFSSKQSAETTRGSVDPLRVMCGAPKVLNLVRFARDATFGHSSYSTWPSSSKYPSEYVDIVIIIYVQELDKEVESQGPLGHSRRFSVGWRHRCGRRAQAGNEVIINGLLCRLLLLQKLMTWSVVVKQHASASEASIIVGL